MHLMIGSPTVHAPGILSSPAHLTRFAPLPIRLIARCVLYYNTILARGPAARPRCIPPAHGAIQALSLLAPSKRIVVLPIAKRNFSTSWADVLLTEISVGARAPRAVKSRSLRN